MMLKRRKRTTRAQRNALTLAAFQNILQKVEAESAAHPEDRALSGVVILCRMFEIRLRNDAAIR